MRLAHHKSGSNAYSEVAQYVGSRQRREEGRDSCSYTTFQHIHRENHTNLNLEMTCSYIYTVKKLSVQIHTYVYTYTHIHKVQISSFHIYRCMCLHPTITYNLHTYHMHPHHRGPDYNPVQEMHMSRVYKSCTHTQFVCLWYYMCGMVDLMTTQHYKAFWLFCGQGCYTLTRGGT